MDASAPRVHEHADELRLMAAGMNDKYRIGWVERTDELLACYVQHGIIHRKYLKPETALWMGRCMTYLRMGSLSDMRRVYWKLMSTHVETKTSYTPKFRQEKGRDPSSMAVSKALKEKLLALRPFGFLPHVREPTAMTIWWHLLWQWRNVVTGDDEGEGYTAKLQAFIGLQRKWVKKSGILTKVQKEMVYLLLTRTPKSF